jgi:hypothetical protein
VTYEFKFRREDREIATGAMTSVCCRMKSDGPPESIAIPPSILKRLNDEPQAT